MFQAFDNCLSNKSKIDFNSSFNDNNLTIIIKGMNNYEYIEPFLSSFFKTRNLIFRSKLSHIDFGFRFRDWYFYRSSFGSYFSVVSKETIKFYKSELKSMVKSFGSASTSFLIKILNSKIIRWKNIYSSSDFFFDITNEIDVYLNKLLWKWAHRRHPRRSNTWIYNKYWSFINNRWYFSCFETSSGKFSILDSHFCNKTVIYRMPYFLNVFDLYNKSKLDLVWFKKLRVELKGIYRFLLVKQSGVCGFCNKPFYKLGFDYFKITVIRKGCNNISNFVLVHNFCLR